MRTSSSAAAVAALIFTAFAASAAPLRGTHAAVEQAAPAETGYLSVTSDPIATLSVDGKSYGKTPVTKIELSVGSHQIALASLDGKLTRTLGVKITKGETTRIKINLGP
jgi:hypothetical protein